MNKSKKRTKRKKKKEKEIFNPVVHYCCDPRNFTDLKTGGNGMTMKRQQNGAKNFVNHVIELKLFIIQI